MYVQSFRARWTIIILAIIVSVIWLAPTAFQWDKDKWWFTKDKMAFGLDIQGGLHLVLGVDMDDVFTHHSQNIAAAIPKELQDEHGLSVTVEVVDPVRGHMLIKGASGSDQDV